MKILLCNIALRATPDSFPPIACTSLFNTLKRAGFSPVFYDIDSKRPSCEEISDFFGNGQFDIVGISAIVSTGYKYTKALVETIKRVSPNTQIILGGNLAAAYEVLLRKCKIDVCVIGKGENTLLKLVEYWKKNGNFKPTPELNQIRGISFLDSDGTCKFTGHDNSEKDLFEQQADYGILGKFSNINNYILDPMTRYDFAYDKRTCQSHRIGKKMATVFTSRGCINKCSFCHRWIEGYKIFTPESVVSAMKLLMDKYNVGFFCISDECFGENREWLERFIELVKPLDILFQVGGARVSIIKKDPAVIRRLKEAGLTALYFGMESGSDKILSIMEKNANIQ